MARRYPNGGRRRPGRRPPHHPPAGAVPGGPGRQGFSTPGMRQVFDAALPMRGADRKQFFNQASTGLIVGVGLGGAILGLEWGGVFGAVVGFGVGVTAAGIFVEKWRFHRR